MKRLILILALCSLPVHAATYYISNCIGSVSGVGNDSNNGTAPATPWLTLSKAGTATASSGDTVLLQRSCIWREPFAGSHNIIYADYGTGLKPSVRGSDTKNTAGNWTNKTGNEWYVSSISHDPGFVMHGDTSQCTGQACAGLIGQRKTSEGALAVQWDSWYDAANSREEIFSVGNPTGVSSSLEVAVRADANADLCHTSSYTNIDMREYYDKIFVMFGCAVVSTFTNVDFGPTATYDIQFNRNTGTGMTATITGSTFTDFGTVSGAQQFGVMAIGGAGPVTVSTSIAVINHSFNSTGMGFVDADVPSCISSVSGNYFYNYGTTPIVAYGLYQAASSCNGVAILWTNNYSWGASMGIDMNGLDDGGATPSSVEFSYNDIEHSGIGDVSDTHAVRCYGTSGSNIPILYKYNIVNGTVLGSNAHAGIGLDACLNAKFYGNTVYGADDGILVKDTSTGNDMRNNGSAFNRAFGIDVSSGTVTTFTNNGFYSNASGNYNGISGGTGDVLGNPFLANVSGGNLRISKNSPWIDAGANLGTTYQLGLDSHSVFPFGTANQNSYGSGWDIGAFVFRPGNAWFSSGAQ